MDKKLYRSSNDKKISGICGGISEYLSIDSTIVRLAFVLFALMGGAGLLFYLVCLFLIPEDKRFN